MSLLDRGKQKCKIFPEVTRLDEDGNTITEPATEGFEAWAVFQIQNQSGTASRRQEQNDEGFETERVYRMRLSRKYPLLEANAEVEWLGARWAVFGDPMLYNGSRRTQHADYSIRRF